MSRLLIDGEPATPDDLAYLAVTNYGAFTSFRVEAGGVRGLDRHLARLEASAVALFGQAVGEARLRDLIRDAAAESEACWLRVSLFSPEIQARRPSWIGAPKVMIAVSAPPSALAESLTLQVRTHARHLPEIKHAATLDLVHARREARKAGYDDALFVDAEGLISEGSTWNIGLVKGDRVTWSLAPMLAGVTQGLVDEGLAGVGLISERRAVRLADLADFDAAFICNSATPACPVTAIGEQDFAVDAALVDRLTTAWTSRPPQPI